MSKTKRAVETDSGKAAAKAGALCLSRIVPPPPLPAGLAPARLIAARENMGKWSNGTVLHFHFLEGGGWTWPKAQKEVVREAFRHWKAVGIGLQFLEVDDASEAEIRIGFLLGDGSWSWVGTDILHNSDRDRTMNFGWDLTDTWGWATALHEIGHTLGFSHEHQSNKAGITWNEPKVYEAFEGEPNNWSRDQIYQNIIRKVDSRRVESSAWDPTSIMEYPFGKDLILVPEKYRPGIPQNTRLSQQDKDWALHFYPTLASALPIGVMDLQRLDPVSGGQRDFVFEPPATRRYTIRTVGDADSKVVVFVDRDGAPRYLTAEDDSGMARNAEIPVQLVKGERYTIRVRTHFAESPAGAALVIF